MITYLGLGTNLGNKTENIAQAIQRINEQVGEVLRRSSDYVSEPWGFQSENTFLNIVVAVETLLEPFDLLQKLQQIEKQLGRTEKTLGEYKDRIIDIDILLYDDKTIATSELVIPHPLINERDFVRIPLAEVNLHGGAFEG